MDTGEGKFTEISEEVFKDATSKNLKGVFKTGQTIELRGSRFYIHQITETDLVLRLLRR